MKVSFAAWIISKTAETVKVFIENVHSHMLYVYVCVGMYISN